jgi:hypothetical protein
MQIPANTEAQRKYSRPHACRRPELRKKIPFFRKNAVLNFVDAKIAQDNSASPRK